MFIGLCKDSWHHIHFSHALTYPCQTIDGGILSTDYSQCCYKGHPDLAGRSQQIFTVQQVRCCGSFQFAPWCIVVKAQYHNGLYQTDQCQANHHAKRHISLRILYVLRYWDDIFCSNKKPECYSHHGYDFFPAANHTVWLLHHRTSSQPKHSDDSHNQHGTHQQKCHQILYFCKHIYTIEIGNHHHNGHNQCIQNTGYWQMDRRCHRIRENRSFYTG